jgi:hypothetical protein
VAGNYMNAPSDRVAYDRDGSLLVAVIGDGSIQNQPTTNMRLVNAEGGAGWTLPSNTGKVAVIFPIPMDVAAAFVYYSSSNPINVHTSKDTTNGVDGTWTLQVSAQIPASSLAPNYRLLSEVEVFAPSSTLTGVRGVRFEMAANPTSGLAGYVLRALHIYAVPSATATDDRLVFWHPTNDAKMDPVYFDWGDVPRGSTEDRSFRIKNMSDNRIAKDTALFFESLTPVTPPTQGMFMLSDNGGSTFLTNLTLPTLNPGQISPVLICRRTIPVDASVSVWTVRMVADVTTWLEV